MSQEILESICSGIDFNLEKKGRPYINDVVEDSAADYLNTPREVFVDFGREYTKLRQDYLMECGENISDHSMDFGRVGLNTFFWGLLGSLYEPDPYTTIGSAVVGGSITLYDEATQSGMDVGTIGWGTFWGGLVGILFDPETSTLCSYVGAGIGFTLGSVKSWNDARKRRKASKREDRSLTKEYEADKEALISRTLDYL